MHLLNLKLRNTQGQTTHTMEVDISEKKYTKSKTTRLGLRITKIWERY